MRSILEENGIEPRMKNSKNIQRLLPFYLNSQQGRIKTHLEYFLTNFREFIFINWLSNEFLFIINWFKNDITWEINTKKPFFYLQNEETILKYLILIILLTSFT